MLLLHSSLTQPETWTKLSPGASRIRTKALAPGAFLEPSPAMLSTEKPSILAGTGKPQGRFLASHYLVNKVHSQESCVDRERCQQGWAAPSLCQ